MHIELRDISKHYPNNPKEILSAVSLQIEPGDAIAVIGPSGSGKSTLLNIIGTLDAPSSGSVLFDGVEIRQFTEPALASLRNKSIGFVFQQHHLLPQLNLLENVLVPAISRKDHSGRNLASRAMELLDSVGLADKVHRLPAELSVGECQRGAVVRALINEPGIILADEPTGSLDNESALQLADLLFKIRKEYALTMVVVTHSTELASRMDTSCRLVNGKLIIG